MRSERTTKSQITIALRRLWLRSRERASALKRDKYTCQNCGVKQSKAKGKEQKVQVHHKNGITNWNEIINCIRKNLLCNPENLETLCPNCHKNKNVY